MGMNTLQKWLVTGALAAGVGLGAASLAGAATSATTTPSSSSSSSAATATGQPPANVDPATLAHGPGETLLTGTTAQKVTAAALAKYPGATVIRVETDNEGSPYEAHLKLADGSYVTVKVNSSFTVTSTEQGFGRGPAGGQAPSGTQAPGA
jgi:hypothetical protein